jgi:hypothetical protein
MKIQERIKSGEQAKRPPGEHRVGSARRGGVNDRRERRLAWATDVDAERCYRPRASRPDPPSEEHDEPGSGSHPCLACCP